MIFKRRYIDNRTSEQGKLYHFLVVSIIFSSKEPLKLVFEAFKAILKWLKKPVALKFSLIPRSKIHLVPKTSLDSHNPQLTASVLIRRHRQCTVRRFPSHSRTLAYLLFLDFSVAKETFGETALT